MLHDPHGKEWFKLLELYTTLNEALKQILSADEYSPLLALVGEDWVAQWEEQKISTADLIVVLSVRMSNLRE